MIVNPYEFPPIGGGIILTDTTLFDIDGNVIPESVYTGDIPDDYYSNGKRGSSVGTLVELGSSCKNIGKRAFKSAAALNGPLIIGHGVTNDIRTIGSEAFYSCRTLNGPVVIGSSVASIGSLAFAYRVQLTDLYFDTPSINWIGDRAFRLSGAGTGSTANDFGKKMVIHVSPQYFNDGINYDESWRSAQQVSSEVEIVNWDWYPYPVPNDNGTVDSILYGVGDSVLAELFGPIPNNWNNDEIAFGPAVRFDLGSSCTSIGDYAFNNNSSLTGNLIVGRSVTSIGSYAFNNCVGLNGELIINNNINLDDGRRNYNDALTNIGDRAFYNCNSLSNELLNLNVNSIGSYAFTYVPITTLSLTNTEVVVGFKSFFSNSSLETAFLGCNISDVNGTAFLNCDKFTKVYAKDATSNGYILGTNKNVGGTAVEVLNWDYYPYPISNEEGPFSTLLYGESEDNVEVLELIEDWIGPIPDDFNKNKDTYDPVRIKVGTTCTSIGKNAFLGNNSLTGSLRIRSTTKTVGDNAFDGAKFTSLILENGIEIIGERAFNLSRSIIGGDLIIPDSVKTIGNYAFNSYAYIGGVNGEEFIPSAGSIVLGSSVTSLGQYAFQNCASFTGSLTMGNSLEAIGNYAFKGCSALTSITIGNSVLDIGEYSFQGCSSITDGITIPDTVQFIKQSAFRDCSIAKTDRDPVTGAPIPTPDPLPITWDGFLSWYDDQGPLIIGNSVEIIQNYGFSKCGGFSAADLELPDTLQSIGAFAFEDCRSFTGSLTIGNSVTTIGPSAFENCFNLDDYLVIGDSIETVGTRAFHDTYFKFAFIGNPESADGFDARVFRNFNQIENTSVGIAVFVNSPDPEAAGFDDEWRTKVSLPADIAVLTWDLYPIPLPNLLDENLTYLFASDDSVLEIYDRPLPNRFNFSGQYGFREGLARLVLGKTCTSIGDYAFSSNDTLAGSLTIPAECKIIGNRSFGACGFDGPLTIENGVETIGSSAFGYCFFTGDLVIPNSVKSIGSGAFYGGFGFGGGAEVRPFEGGTLTIGNSVETIGSSAFYYGGGFIGSLNIPESVTTIGNSAFSQCTGFTGDIILPRYLTFLDDNAFRSSTGFDGEIVINNLLTEIGNFAFNRCTGLTGSLTLGKRVENIGNSAFRESSITGFVNIPNSVTNIGYDAFKDCTGLDDYIVIPNSVTSIQSRAFENCSNVKYLFVDTPIDPWISEGNIIRASQFAGMTSLEFILVKTPEVSYDPESAYQGSDAFVYEGSSYRVNDNETLAIGETPTTNPEKLTIIKSGILYLTTSVYQGGDAFFYEGSSYRVNDGETLAVGETPTTNPEKLTIIEASGIPYDPASTYQGGDAFVYEDSAYRVNDGETLAVGETPTTNPEKVTVINLSGMPYIPTSSYQGGDAFFYEDSAYRVNDGETLAVGETPTTNPEKVRIIDLSIIPYDPASAYQGGDAFVYEGSYSAFEVGSPYNGYYQTVYRVNDGETLAVGETPTTNPEKLTIIDVSNPASIGYQSVWAGGRGLSYSTSDTRIIEWENYPAPVINGLAVNLDPSFEQLGDQENIELAPISLQVVATDPEEGVLTYSAIGLPDGISIDPVTGLISGTISAGTHVSSPYDVTVTVVDDSDSPLGIAEELFFWTITVNFPPIVEPIDDQTNQVTDFISIDGFLRSRQRLQVVATDPNNELEVSTNDILTYSATGLPEGIGIDAETGLIYGLIPDGAEAFSPYNVTVTVTDDGIPIEGSQESFIWTVNPLPLDTILYGVDGNVIPESIYTGDIPDSHYQSGRNGSNQAYTLELGMSCTTIGSRAFYLNPNLVGDLQIPDSVVNIGSQAFQYCSGFNGRLSLGHNFSIYGARIRTIGTYAFRSCQFIGDLVIPDTVTSIGEGAFTSRFTSLVVGSGLTDEFCIGRYAFSFPPTVDRDTGQYIAPFFTEMHIACPASAFSEDSFNIQFDNIRIYVNDPDPAAAGFDDDWLNFVGLARPSGPAIISTWEAYPNFSVTTGATVLFDSNGDII